jgi:hypothetical protein
VVTYCNTPRFPFRRLSHNRTYTVSETFTRRRRIYITGNNGMDLEDSGDKIKRFGPASGGASHLVAGVSVIWITNLILKQ